MHYDAPISQETALAVVIGQRIRAERTARSWTLDQLAEAAQLSRRSLINLEQGSANPSVAVLLKLSQALQVGLPDLVAPPDRAPLRITRSGEGAQLWSGPDGGAGVLVASDHHRDVVELWSWTLHPGESHASEAHPTGTRELLQVHSGRLSVEVDGERVELGAGDAVAFVGDQSHSYANRSTEPTSFSLAVFEPSPPPTARTK